ncbi:class E sortase [Streptomyces sp. URMC 125]|uniref:class E sortase n=1 Tax=Streptomyces sp. URMC 125 TaxID=3423419 RepID=UPI003F1CC653
MERQAFEAAVEQLADPLNDPLPGREPTAGVPGPEPFPGVRPEAYAPPRGPAGHPGPYPPGPAAFIPAPPPSPAASPPGPGPHGVPAGDDGTMALRQVRDEAADRPGRTDETMALRRLREPAPPVAHGEHGAHGGRDAHGDGGERPPSPPPGGRAARRRAQRAARESPAVMASRIAGELFITLGVVMLLFVSYQLWWTNVIADRHAGNEARKLEEQWGDEKKEARDPGAFSPGEGFAIMHIPRLDVKVPIAEGIDENGVLDRGMVGHYGEEPLKTAMPWDEKGNFAVAGHRNTHGEPFRYINRLDPGDPIVVETRDTYYVYEMTSRLDSTPPSNVGVIGPVPPGSGFTGPGRYITLTTCTPEFTSKYRLIVWGKLAEERPRSEGKPDALVR